jgi:hypothetical protein
MPELCSSFELTRVQMWTFPGFYKIIVN